MIRLVGRVSAWCLGHSALVQAVCFCNDLFWCHPKGGDLLKGMRGGGQGHPQVAATASTALLVVSTTSLVKWPCQLLQLVWGLGAWRSAQAVQGYCRCRLAAAGPAIPRRPGTCHTSRRSVKGGLRTTACRGLGLRMGGAQPCRGRTTAGPGSYVSNATWWQGWLICVEAGLLFASIHAPG